MTSPDIAPVFLLITMNISSVFPAIIYLFKVNNENTITVCEICSKLTIKTTERSGVFIVNFEQISHIVLLLLLLNLNKWMSAGLIFCFDF